MQIQREWDGEIMFNHGTNTARGPRGFPILLHSRLESSVKQKQNDNEGRILNIVLELSMSLTFTRLKRTANVERSFLAWVI